MNINELLKPLMNTEKITFLSKNIHFYDSIRFYLLPKAAVGFAEFETLKVEAEFLFLLTYEVFQLKNQVSSELFPVPQKAFQF